MMGSERRMERAWSEDAGSAPVAAPADVERSRGGAGVKTRPRVLFVDHTAAMGGAELMLLDLARAYGDAGAVALLADGPLRTHLEAVGVAVEVVAAPAAVHGVRRGGGALSGLAAVPGVLRTALRLARRARPFGALYANSQKALVV